ncbi:hypothetical protein K431DRAFT_294106 [Polychaeton citri CBS 116435]|uniref:Zn(2)-C6 fungal-type domain-containing protein n=1 Tax=Polychaeton citri CBS 116435 TaxID=1314669 RepID=A0A9P4UR64_9PEZI|nr:hypothetical protein K431DRAFT_294106 [Polychaeton citri CBS 116435]
MHDHDSDKKRNKLGYQRTSVACSHCRRRKIRCLMQESDPQGRCQNCVKLKRECVFQPVDQNREPDGISGPSNNARSETRNGNSSPRERPPRRQSAASPSSSNHTVRLQSTPSATGYVGEPIPASDASSAFDGIDWPSRPLSTADSRTWSPTQFSMQPQISSSSTMDSPTIYGLQTNAMGAAAGAYAPVLPGRVQSPHHINQQGQTFTRPHYPSETTALRSATTGGSVPMYGLPDGGYAQTAMPRYSTQGLDASSLSQYPNTLSSYPMPMQAPGVPQYGQQSPYATFTSAQSIPSSYYTSQAAYGMDGQGMGGSQYSSRSRPA